MSSRFDDISDQSPKLSEIAPNFERFFALPKILGADLAKLIPILLPLPRGTSLEMFCDDTPTSPEVMGIHTLNYKQNFKLSRFVRPNSQFECALVRPGQSVTRVKI